MDYGLLILALAQASGPALTAAPQVMLESRVIRLGDVLDTHALPPSLAPGLADRPVARIAEGRTSIAIPRTSLASLVRRTVPALNPQAGAGSIRFTVSGPRALPDTGCWELARPVLRGQALASEDLVPVDCEGHRRAGDVTFLPKSATVHAVHDLPAGAYMGRLALPPAPAVRSGTPLTLVTRSGPVTIEREVKTLQDGRAGDRIFVVDAEGQVFSAPLATDAADR